VNHGSKRSVSWANMVNMNTPSLAYIVHVTFYISVTSAFHLYGTCNIYINFKYTQKRTRNTLTVFYE
jgi:hypothetical protein